MKFTHPVYREVIAGEQQERWKFAYDNYGVFFRPLGKHLWACMPSTVLIACYGAEDIKMGLRPGVYHRPGEAEAEIEKASEVTGGE